MTNEQIIVKTKEECKLRGLSPRTEDEYLKRLDALIRYYENRPLEELNETDIRVFLLYLLNEGRKSSTVNVYNSSFRFVFGAVLGRNLNYQQIPRSRIHRELPQIMSKSDIVRLLCATDNLRDKIILTTIYAAGLRLSEIAKLRVQDIDSQGMRVFVQSTTFYLHLINFNGTIKSPLDSLPKKRGRKPKTGASNA